MNSLFSLIESRVAQKSEYKSRRDELVSLMTADINLLRLNTKIAPTSKKLVALRLNCNPFYARDDDTVQDLYNFCHEVKHYGKFFNDCPLNKKSETLRP